MIVRATLVSWGLTAALLLAVPAHAQPIANAERQLLPLMEGALKDAPGIDDKLWESLEFLRIEEQRQRALKGSVTFGLTGDESGPRSLFKLNTGISLSRGVFPSEIAVDTLLSLQLVNGQVQEDVTSLKISYDYHATHHLQYFAFAERFSDNFLSIQQRYEVGFGARVSYQTGRVGNWAQADRQFANLRRNLPGIRALAPDLSPEAQVRLRDSGVMDAARFETALDNLEHEIGDGGTRLMVGLAASVFAEIENAAIDVVSSPGASADSDAPPAFRTTLSVDGTHRYRLNLRPTLRLRPSPQIVLRVFPYWKLPLHNIHSVSATDGKRHVDYRRDILSDMTWTIRPAETGVEAVDFVFTFNHFFDNVPPALPAVFLDEARESGRVLSPIVAQQSHRFVAMSLRIRW